MMAEKVSGGVPIAKFIRNSPVPACTGASTWELSEEAAKAIALSLCSLCCPRLIPRWIRSNLVRFLPESTWWSVTWNPVCCFWCSRTLLDVEDAGKTKNKSKKNINEHKEYEEAMIECIGIGGRESCGIIYEEMVLNVI
jgi:hypothetical protein